jgi:hypothetical protein
MYRGISFCVPVSKKSAAFELSHVLYCETLKENFHRAIQNKVVKQLPVEVLQQCSSASSCMRTHIGMEEHYTGCQHYKPFVLNDPMQFIFSVSQHKTWLSSQAADFFDTGTQKLTP